MAVRAREEMRSRNIQTQTYRGIDDSTDKMLSDAVFVYIEKISRAAEKATTKKLPANASFR